MQPTKTQNIVGQATTVLEAALRELYLVAGVEQVVADHRQEFESLRAAIETAKQDLAGIKTEIDAGRAALAAQAVEREARQRELAGIDQQRREHAASLENLRKKLGEAA